MWTGTVVASDRTVITRRVDRQLNVGRVIDLEVEAGCHPGLLENCKNGLRLGHPRQFCIGQFVGDVRL